MNIQAINTQLSKHIGRDGEVLEFCHACCDYCYPDDMDATFAYNADQIVRAEDHYKGACCFACVEEFIEKIEEQGDEGYSDISMLREHGTWWSAI